MRVGSALVVAASLLLLVAPSEARAACRPASGAVLTGDLSIRAQVVVAPEAAQPWVVVRCYVEGSVPAQLVIPVTSAETVPQVITVDAWDRLWTATSPRAIERGTPSAAVGEVPQHDLDPPVAAVLDDPHATPFEADVALAGLEVGEALPEEAQALVAITPRSPEAASGHWTPWVRLPLATGADGAPVLPLLPEAEVAGEGGRASIETAVILLGAERYWALGGFDLWDAVDRPAGGLPDSAAAAAPNPVLVVPDLRVAYNQRAQGGFPGFYARRVGEVSEGAAFPVAVLQYASSLGRRDALLPQPEPLEWYTAANRLVRERLDGAAGRLLTLTEAPPTLYLPVFATRPLAEQPAQVDPSELDLSSDMQLFGFGAESLGELTPTMVRGTIDENLDRIMACNPGGDEPTPVDLQLMVEPGGTTVGVFVGVSMASVGQCLIDTFADTLFPLATGSPVGVRFPIVYQQ